MSLMLSCDRCYKNSSSIDLPTIHWFSKALTLSGPTADPTQTHTYISSTHLQHHLLSLVHSRICLMPSLRVHSCSTFVSTRRYARFKDGAAGAKGAKKGKLGKVRSSRLCRPPNNPCYATTAQKDKLTLAYDHSSLPNSSPGWWCHWGRRAVYAPISWSKQQEHPHACPHAYWSKKQKGNLIGWLQAS
jgi:hypothetical protein